MYFLIILNIPRTFLLVVFSDHKNSIFTSKSFAGQIYSGYENIDVISYAERSIACIDRRIVVVRYAMKENWAGAAFATAQAKHNWEKWDLLRSALADHTPSEEIDALFAALEVYGSAKDKVAFSALCRELSLKMLAIGDAHSLKFHNLL